MGVAENRVHRGPQFLAHGGDQQRVAAGGVGGGGERTQAEIVRGWREKRRRGRAVAPPRWRRSAPAPSAHPVCPRSGQQDRSTSRGGRVAARLDSSHAHLNLRWNHERNVGNAVRFDEKMVKVRAGPRNRGRDPAAAGTRVESPAGRPAPRRSSCAVLEGGKGGNSRPVAIGGGRFSGGVDPRRETGPIGSASRGAWKLQWHHHLPSA